MRLSVFWTSGAIISVPWVTAPARTGASVTAVAVVGSRKSTPALTAHMPIPIGIISSGSSTPFLPR